MRIATWNINSIRARYERVLVALERNDLDVLALQEIKCKSEQFPREAFEAAGYEVAAYGVNQWNGVAILSRVGLKDVCTEFPGQPGFEKGHTDSFPERAELGFLDSGVPEARALGATVGASEEGPGIELWSLYVPNGRAVGDPHYHYKLEFLRRLREYAAEHCEKRAAKYSEALSSAPLMLVGDWNVIPTDEDVWDVAALDSDLYMTPAEREAFFDFESAGLREVTRPFVTNYTYWDYQRLRFPRNEGMRIDYMYASEGLAQCVTTSEIDRDERKGTGASDHVPVIVDLAI